MHPGSVNVLLCDGAVRNVSDAVDTTVWRNLGNRADGNPIGDY
jgi:prepilin-type processing-associated H-X9-DG protein